MFSDHPTAAHPVPVEAGPLPEWVSPDPAEPRRPGASVGASGGIITWLDDTQVNVLDPEHVWFHRRVVEVTTVDGLQAASTLDISLEPSYERVRVHAVQVVRGGAVRDALQLERAQFLRRERDLERGVYDGEVTVHLIIPDLRVGDVVETAYSLERRHPVTGDWFSASICFQFDTPVGETRFRLLARPERKFSIRTWGKPPAPELSAPAPGVVVRLWRAVDVPPMSDEPDAPGWWRSWSSIRIGDEIRWPQVADLFRGAYAIEGALPTDVEAEAARIEHASSDPEERIAQAVRYVQSSLRYIAIGIGESGYRPKTLAEIVSSRSGDCKDASRLLCALLQRLGVRADPALVHTRADPDLGHQPPYINAFNHCLVRVEHGSRTYWLDPTNSPQGGRLGHLVQARFGWALPLVDNAELESMGEDELATLRETTETWSFGPRPSSSAELQVVTTHRGSNADDLRNRIANDGLRAVGDHWRDYYEREYGALTELGDPEVEDRPETNEIVTIERYCIERPWTRSDDGKTVLFQTIDDLFNPALTTPESPRRRDPIDLGGPRRYQATHLLHLPAAIAVDGWDDQHQGPGVVGRSVLAKLSPTATILERLRLDRHIEFNQRTIGPEESGAYFEFARRMRQTNGVCLRAAASGDRFGVSRMVLLGRLLLALGIGGLLAWLFSSVGST